MYASVAKEEAKKADQKKAEKATGTGEASTGPDAKAS